MGHLMFYLAAVAACLLWTAAFVAAAARTDRTWLRRLLVAVAVVVPLLAVAPWVLLTAALAFRVGLETNWFAPTFTAFVSALVGGLWLCRAGFAWSPAANRLVAAAWPVVVLAAGCVLAKACSFGTLLFIDNAVAAEGRILRVEAAQMMAAVLPPAPGPDENAAPLYQRAAAALAADESLGDPQSPFSQSDMNDVGAPEVSAILARHAGTLELLRRATDRPGCRFDRDWSRPSLNMPLPEVQEIRQAARLLMLAARRAAADGDGEQALADIVRIHRLGMHTASEPLLVSGLVGQAIDANAIGTLADVLPRLDKDDLPLLDTDAVRDFVETPIRYPRAFLGEEAFGLATLGDLADGVDGTTTLELLRSVSDAPTRFVFDRPFSLLYRCFLLPADITGYRSIMDRYQALFAALGKPAPQLYATLVNETAAIKDDLTSRRAGIFAALLAPSLESVLTFQSKGEALHGVAGVLVAATRARLAGASLADSLAPGALPRDPFTADAFLLAKRSDDGWVVWSVGPDGEDDGGPPAPGVQQPQGNDDVGLRMALSAASD